MSVLQVTFAMPAQWRLNAAQMPPSTLRQAPQVQLLAWFALLDLNAQALLPQLSALHALLGSFARLELPRPSCSVGGGTSAQQAPRPPQPVSLEHIKTPQAKLLARHALLGMPAGQHLWSLCRAFLVMCVVQDPCQLLRRHALPAASVQKRKLGSCLNATLAHLACSALAVLSRHHRAHVLRGTSV